MRHADEPGRRYHAAMSRCVGTLLFLVSLAVGCDRAGANGGANRPLVVFAAASMGDAIREVADGFERAHGAGVEISAAGSGILRRQIETGAPCDVFISADAEHMDRLEAAGRIEPDTRCDIASNTLVIVARRRDATPWPDPEPLRDPAIGRIAVGNPDYVPAGRYAREALKRHGLWSALASRLVYADNVRLVLGQMTLGAIDCGIIYRSDVAGTDSANVVYEFAANAHSPIRYPAAAVARDGLHPGAAAFCAYLRSDEAKAILRGHGFGVVEAAPAADGVPDRTDAG